MAICRFEYAAKVVCGEVRERGEALAPGVYVTEINVYNPNERPVILRKRLAVSVPPGAQKEGESYADPEGEHALRPGRALAVDCRHVGGFIPQPTPPAPAAPYFIGFLVIESTDSVDVTAVYTTASLHELGVPSIAVELVRERKKAIAEDR